MIEEKIIEEFISTPEVETQQKCIYCREPLSSDNVYMYQTRSRYVDKCDSCTDALELGLDMYE